MVGAPCIGVGSIRKRPKSRPVALIVPADFNFQSSRPLLELAVAAGIGGWLVDGSIRDRAAAGCWVVPARAARIDLLRQLRIAGRIA